MSDANRDDSSMNMEINPRFVRLASSFGMCPKFLAARVLERFCDIDPESITVSRSCSPSSRTRRRKDSALHSQGAEAPL